MARYSNTETLKIEYFKSRIKELRYLQHELHNINDRLCEIEHRLRCVSNDISLRTGTKPKGSVYNTSEKWNNLIHEKELLSYRKKLLTKELECVNLILDSLQPKIKNIAIDLLVKKMSLTKICDKYFITNPYQCVNDELRYLEIDKF